MENADLSLKQFMKERGFFMLFLDAVVSKLLSNSFTGFALMIISGFAIVIIPAYLIAKKSRKKKVESGNAFYIHGHEITKNNYPALFALGKIDGKNLSSKVQKYADAECGSNTSLALRYLEQELHSNSKKPEAL
jgi:hypothetical protein